ncbi:MAG: BrnT family toxin [Zoogloeaceae bacterium]|jgi:uncharacterized DUF497 family protein|nr:BrnT family toxin [Zoogloeaceae bacterium]
MKVEFDPVKAAMNPIKHEGVTFEEAEAVLFNPLARTHEDPNVVDEQRFISLGMGGRNRLLVVVWALRDADPIRLISAWKASKSQRRDYENQY